MVIPQRLPDFTYTGEYDTELRADWGWIIRLKTDGTLTFNDRDHKIDLFLVGGGSIGVNAWKDSGGGKGGAGGYIATHESIDVAKGQAYSVTIGVSNGAMGDEAGGASKFGEYTSGSSTRAKGGGAGGGDTGGKGGDGFYEFGAEGWNRYGGAGGGGGKYGGAGGAGGGGRGGNRDGHGSGGGKNTGGGGGGAGQATSWDYPTSGGGGGSGIVCIRNNENDAIPIVYDGRQLQRLFFNGVEVQSLIFNGARLFIEKWKGAIRCLFGSMGRSCAAR